MFIYLYFILFYLYFYDDMIVVHVDCVYLFVNFCLDDHVLFCIYFFIIILLLFLLYLFRCDTMIVVYQFVHYVEYYLSNLF